MHRTERHLIADRRLQQLADVNRSADHELAERERVAFRQRRMDGVLDAAHAVAFRYGELDRVIAWREAGAGFVLER